MVVGDGGSPVRYYCLTDRLRAVLAQRGFSDEEPRCPVAINRRWHVMAFPAHAESRYLFSIATESPGASVQRPM